MQPLWIAYCCYRRIIRHFLRYYDLKFTAPAGLAGYHNKSAHLIDHSLRNGKPQPDPALLAVAPCICLVKSCKKLLLAFLVYSKSRILDADNQIDPIVRPAAADYNAHAAFRRKFQCIVYQIHNNPSDFLLISIQAARKAGVTIHYQLDFLSAPACRSHINQVIYCRRDIIILLCQRHLARLQLRKIQDVTDYRQQAASCGLYAEYI